MIQSRYDILVLGTVQDGGYPHIDCKSRCCLDAWKDASLKKYISSIAIVDHEHKKYFLVDITPDFSEQLNMLYKTYSAKYVLSGIFLTHAHVGHYTGLFKLGLEMMNSDSVPVYAMPKLMKFLQNNSSTNFLFESNNIVGHIINNNQNIKLSENFNITPFFVPHRNELSETVGYKMQSNNKSVIYIPDIDSWEEWNLNIIDVVKQNDILMLDGTFYNKDELSSRDINKIPHPSILESLEIFRKLPINQKKKIYFTHLNHTNNLLRENSTEYKDVIDKNFNILKDQQIFML